MEAKERAYLIELARSLPHKNQAQREHWNRVHPNLLRLVEFYAEFCIAHVIKPMNTRIIDAKIDGVSKTDVHADARAFDASSRGWTKQLQQDFTDVGNRRFEKIAAVTASGPRKGMPTAYQFHEGTAWHMHAQVRA
jgi:hypothetical protein